MAAVLVTDLVGSTRLTDRLGTDAFQASQASLEERTAEACTAHGGVLPDDVNSGDGTTAQFATAVAAVLAGQEVVLAGEAIGLQVRAGVHACAGAGRRDLADTDRICAAAAPGELVVSSPVLDEVPALADWVTPAGRLELSAGDASLFRLRTIVPAHVLDQT